jgi:multidrug resistance efflux pump
MKAAGSASEKRTRALQELESARADLAAAQRSGSAQSAIDSANARIANSQELADLATTDLADAHRVMSEGVGPATVRIPPKP